MFEKGGECGGELRAYNRGGELDQNTLRIYRIITIKPPCTLNVC
jgi:hypothetical protein